MTPSIAPHLREDIFRRYESLIKRAVDAFPTETSFTIPSNVAPTTFVANFRNAILSVKNYKWPTDIDMNKLWAITGKFVISQDATGLVWFRLRGRRGRPLELTSEARSHAPQIDSAFSLVPWRDATEEEIAALCLLIDRQRAEGPFVIEGKITEGVVDRLQTDFNVALVYDEAKNQTVIT